MTSQSISSLSSPPLLSASSSSSSNNHFLPPLPTTSTSSSNVKIKIHHNQKGSSSSHDENYNSNNRNERNQSKERESLIIDASSHFYDNPLMNVNNNGNQQQQQQQQIGRLGQELEPLVPYQQQIQHQQVQHINGEWPLPFDDQSAIQQSILQNLSNGNNSNTNTNNQQFIKEQIYETNQIMVRIITWNQQAKPLPSVEELRKHVFSMESNNHNQHDSNKFHIIAIGTQECENSFSKSILNPVKENWERCCIDALGTKDYVFVQSHALQATHLIVFAHKAVTHLITDINSHAVATGIYNTLGNKGGIGISFFIGNTSFCFLTAHLAAHQEQLDRRTVEFATISKDVAERLGRGRKGGYNRQLQSNNTGSDERDKDDDTTDAMVKEESVDEDYEYISLQGNTDVNNYSNDTNHDDDEIRKKGKSWCCFKSSQSCKPCTPCCSSCCHGRYRDQVNPLLNEFDHVFWGGDLNYRINATRDVVDSLLKYNRHDVLLGNDQLNLLLQFEKTFAGFVEGAITFRPTYKYDEGKDVYDTSSKKRVPSWTDRILYKMSSQVKLISYFCAQEIRASDHRPVYASFQCTVNVDKDEMFSIMENDVVLRSESRSEVCVIS